MEDCGSLARAGKRYWSIAKAAHVFDWHAYAVDAHRHYDVSLPVRCRMRRLEITGQPWAIVWFLDELNAAAANTQFSVCSCCPLGCMPVSFASTNRGLVGVAPFSRASLLYVPDQEPCVRVAPVYTHPSPFFATDTHATIGLAVHAGLRGARDLIQQNGLPNAHSFFLRAGTFRCRLLSCARLAMCSSPSRSRSPCSRPSASWGRR